MRFLADIEPFRARKGILRATEDILKALRVLIIKSPLHTPVAGSTKARPSGCGGFFVILFLVLLLFSLPLQALASSRIVAKVGGRVLTERDLNITLARILPYESFHRNVRGERLERLKKRAFRRLIEKTLVVIDGEKRVSVTDGELQKRFDEIRKRFASEAEFKKALDRAEETVESLKARLRDDIIYEKTMEIMVNRASVVTEEEARQYYRDHRDSFLEPQGYRLKEIFISVPASATAGERRMKKKKAEQIYQRLLKGEDFGTLAYQLSEDRFRYVSGQLKDIHKGRLDPSIEKIIERTPEGRITPPVETIYGYYIFYVEKKLPQRHLSFEQVRDKLIRDLSKKKRQETKARYIESLLKKTPVEILATEYEDIFKRR